jgi:2,3-bisphosphoglycerate-dependent phosphoglycerate mutase
MIKIVLLRHGETTYNRDNRFTGWTNVDLSEKGVKEAKEAGQIFKKENYTFDIIFTSIQKRSTETTDIVLKEMGSSSTIINCWRLNERHYGALQGLNKSEMATKYGEEQVLKWRRSYDIQPPALTEDDERYSGNDPLYKDIDKKDIPLTESLKDCVARVLPQW